MCAVSATIGYFQERHFTEWTRPNFNAFKDILERLGDLDEKLGQPDCIDPGKAKYLQDIEERLERLEEKVGERSRG